jgi:hypothetical protein
MRERRSIPLDAGHFSSHYSRAMTKTLMTLKEFVRRLEPLSRENPDTLKRQIRFWTEVEAIPVANVVSTGSGKMRLYDEESLLYAAVAIEMATWGVTIGFIKSVLRKMTNHIRGKSLQVQLAIGGHRDVRLIVTIGDTIGDAHISIEDILETGDSVSRDHLGSPRYSVFVVNLTSLWAELR